MIDFRYHLVSLIAVFLAVALGIVIGTTQLNDPILTDIENQVTDLEQDKRALEDRTQELQAQVDTSDAFAQTVAPALVEGTLSGGSVLLVVTNEDVAPETVEQVTALIGQAGATVTGTVRLLPGYSDPSSSSSLQSYVTGGGLPAGVTVPPEAEDAGELVASLLAQVLMVPADGGAAPDPTAASSVLAGLASLEVVEGSSVQPAEQVVFLTAGEFTGGEAAERNATLVELVTALDRAGSGAVVAGDAASARENGLVGAIRADQGVSGSVSTVDNVATAAGQASAVLALRQERAGTSGAYGTGEEAQPVPALASATP
ncbi:copper transporter [Blastococcus sp. TF02A-30]|uniref:copper transporter n=1 Tax=Blastococcus sp. TF02A-30 TaxID=2250580 RepID=UPI000DE82094|nr:copper transporter [Blastococcus sp. TF02A-30]RBY87572.1 copper transporter [Blastococcus sp. TF02A-30]